MDPQHRVREHVLDAHGDLVDAVADCADDVAGDVSLPADRARVVARMDRALSEAGAFPELVEVARTVADALEADLPADPVPAPPYVVVTGRGPMVRATVDAGRVVVLFRAFDLTAGGYDRADATRSEAVEVTIHES